MLDRMEHRTPSDGAVDPSARREDRFEPLEIALAWLHGEAHLAVPRDERCQ